MHQDIFGAKVRGRPEFVFLLFLGESRILRFVDEDSGLITFDIECKHGGGLFMTPLSNDLWKHSKMPSETVCGPAASIAYREGLPLFYMLSTYPAYRKYFKDVFNGDILGKLRNMGL